jgi:hypothetical protein
MGKATLRGGRGDGTSADQTEQLAKAGRCHEAFDAYESTMGTEYYYDSSYYGHGQRASAAIRKHCLRGDPPPDLPAPKKRRRR